MIQHFELNKVGNDYVMGDLHGCFPELKQQLYDIGFRESCDRLFSVGDLVDRGLHSEYALEWLRKSWFHVVRGNHESMAIDASEGFIDIQNYIWNGGGWFLDLPVELQKEFANEFKKLPIAIEVDTPFGMVGIIHAECPVAKWEDLKEAFNGPNSESFINICLWNRDRLKNGLTSIIEGVHSVIVGHSVVYDDTWFGNVHYIDTGLVFGKKLTIIKIN